MFQSDWSLAKARGVVEVVASGLFWLWLWLYVWPLVTVRRLLGWTTQYCTLQNAVTSVSQSPLFKKINKGNQ